MIYYFQGFACGIVPALVLAVVICAKRAVSSVVWE